MTTKTKARVQSSSRSTAKKSSAKKAPSKKASTKKASGTKSTAIKGTVKKGTVKKASSKKARAKSTAPKKPATSTASKPAPAPKKLTTKKAPIKRKALTLRSSKAKSPEKLSPAERKRHEQERIDRIWKTFKRTGDENLRNILVEYHFPLVRYIAERLLQTLPKSIDLDDLVSAGTFGLLDAIRGFDLKRGIKFKTYCSTRIRGSILDELRSQDWVPRLVRLKAHKLDKAITRLEAQNGREVNDYELARDLELSMDELSHLKSEASPKTMFSLSEKLDESDDDRDMEKVEIIEDKKGCDPVQSLHQQDVLEIITSNLTKKERLIVIMYYYEGLTMREIGDIMSLTESRVCQIHSNVMGRLKTQLDAIAQ